MAGCQSDTGSPVTPGLSRAPQQIFPFGIWSNKGFSIDSASSMWVLHEDVDKSGDLALTDDFNGEVSTLATAFVKANRSVAATDGVIRLVVFDLNGTVPDFQTDIKADGVYYPSGMYFCRHPSVEVTYFREPGAPEGHLGIHVIWSQLTGMGLDVDWELFYQYYHFIVDENGINWTPAGSFLPTTLLASSSPIDDDIEPDLSVDARNGSLLTVYVKTDEPDNTFYQIMAMQGVIQPATPAFWNPIEYPVPSGPPHLEKGFPKIDVGLIDMTFTPPFIERNTAVAVWSEWDENLGNFQVWYAEADPLNPGSITSMQLTYSQNFTVGPYEYEVWDVLPSVDIPAPSSRSSVNPNLQAVICYSGMDVREWYGVRYVYDTRVHCRITPDIVTDFLLKGDPGHDANPDMIEARVPEVACHQMNDLLAPDQWFGVAMQATYGMSGQGRTYLATWKYHVDMTGVVQMNTSFLDEWYYPFAYPYWSLDHPATGPTLCLREYVIPSTPDNQIFGVGWINDIGNEPQEVMLGQGTITIY